MPARDRVYNEIKMRGAVRYPAVTIKQLVGKIAKIPYWEVMPYRACLLIEPGMNM